VINPKRQRFIEEYLVDCNGKQAAIRAGYSEKTAEVQGSQLLSMLKVVIDERLAQNAKRLAGILGITKERWVREIARLTLVDPGAYFDTHGNPIEICTLPAQARRALAGFEFYEDFEGKGESRKAVGYTRKFKWHDKIRALELLGKALGYYTEKKEPPGVARRGYRGTSGQFD
ncbi:MAG: terminase small subunit, partial [Nitrospiraceae bacterium]